MITKSKKYRLLIRRKRARSKVSGLKSHRITVHRSNKHVSASLIDEKKGVMILTVHESHLKLTGKKTKSERATLVGEKLAENAKKHKIKTVVFDRSGYLYHGRVKALAEGIRKGGLSF